MSALIHALYEMGMAIVVRYVFRNNSTPKLCALFPHIKADYEVGNDHMTFQVCVPQFVFIVYLLRSWPAFQVANPKSKLWSVLLIYQEHNKLKLSFDCVVI